MSTESLAGSVGSPGSKESKGSIADASPLDGCGPPAPAAVPRPQFEARLAGRSRVFTRAGCPTLESLAGKEAEVWTGRRWAPVRVAELPRLPGGKMLDMRLDNGAHIECAPDHPWALVVQPNIRPVRAQDAEANHFTAPFLAIDPQDLTGSGDEGAYQRGLQFGLRVGDRRKSRVGAVPEKVFGFSSEALGLFIAGWADAQAGSFFGPRVVIQDLKVLMCRVGVCSTAAFNSMNDTYILSVSSKDSDRIPNPKGAARSFLGLGGSAPPRLTVVGRADHSSGRLYTIQSDATHLVVVNGVLTIC